jgi:serine/threonine-protein kinase
MKIQILKRIRMHDKAVRASEMALEMGLGLPTIMMHIIVLSRLDYLKTDTNKHYTITEKGKAFLDSQQGLEAESKVQKKETILGDKYVLEESVGKGTYGEVWKATDKSLERTVAVKVLHGGLKDFQQLKNEGKALSALTHKNIVIVHDLDSDKENGWLVMELIDGPSLQEYLKNSADEGKWPSFEESRKIVEQLLEGLEYAHDKNRVHGDIKPGNIFLPVTGEAKIGDFGVAKILGGAPEMKGEYPPGYARRLGSSSCAAPEVLKGQPRDFQSDLFSVGIVAYLLLTGQHPFMHKSGLILIPELIKSDTYVPKNPKELIEGIPEKYSNIVMRLLEKDRSKRYQKAREVLDEWREKPKMVQCPECSAENSVLNKFCGQCGSALGLTRQSKLQPEKDLNASFALFTAGRSQDAIKLIRQTLAKNKDFARGWSQLGFMLNYERQYEEAEDACTRSIKIDPKPPSPYQTRGFARSNLGRYKEAIEDFTKAFDRETDERRQSMILYNRGYSKKLDGNFKEAYEDALMALKLDETNPKAKKLKESLEPLV